MYFRRLVTIALVAIALVQEPPRAKSPRRPKNRRRPNSAIKLTIQARRRIPPRLRADKRFTFLLVRDAMAPTRPVAKDRICSMWR